MTVKLQTHMEGSDVVTIRKQAAEAFGCWRIKAQPDPALSHGQSPCTLMWLSRNKTQTHASKTNLVLKDVNPSQHDIASSMNEIRPMV